MSLILGSKSEIRRHMLNQAALDYLVVPPSFDEEVVKQVHVGDCRQLAMVLAEGKALSVPAEPQDWVIGSDSTLEVDGHFYSKPRDREEAAAHLRAFSGRVLKLSSAAALARAGLIDWSYGETAQLSVRPLSDDFIKDYLDREWPDVSHCVGVFRLEGLGVTLFDKIEGSYFTVLGMPLLPLLGALRQRGIMTS